METIGLTFSKLRLGQKLEISLVGWQITAGDEKSVIWSPLDALNLLHRLRKWSELSNSLSTVEICNLKSVMNSIGIKVELAY